MKQRFVIGQGGREGDAAAAGVGVAFASRDVCTRL